MRAGGAGRVVAIFSGTQLLESEGQRPTQLALALARGGVPVVFVYWRWWDNEWRPQDRLEEGIVQIPIDVVTRRPETLTAAFEGLERIALFEFPHPGFFETLAGAASPAGSPSTTCSTTGRSSTASARRSGTTRSSSAT